jgi:hypothetical protein
MRKLRVCTRGKVMKKGKPTKGLPEVVDCAVEDHDRETWNSKVKAGTRDTRFI